MTKGRIFSSSTLFWTFTFVLGLLYFTSSGSAATQPATFTTSTYPFLGNNHIAADLNGDGKVDLAGTGVNSAAVMLGNGNGTFQPKVAFPVAGQAQDLAAGDFNGDGHADLVVTINSPEISLSLLTGNGDGTFKAPVNFPNSSGFDSPAVVATDLNNDGKLDVVIAHQIGCFTAPCMVARTISVMLGNGNGAFQPTQEIEVGTGMSRIAVGDFNLDGIKDLAISGDRAQVYVLMGAGDGTFVQRPTITLISGDATGVDGTDIDVSDFNHDAVQDLVVAIGLNGSRTAILIGNGDGSFGSPSIITDTTLSVPQYQAVADYNGDGFQDLAIALGNGTGGLMEILNGNGDGTFQAPTYYLVPAPQSSIGGGTLVAGHFNADGNPDIALQVVGANPALKVLINTSGPPPTPANTTTPSATPTAGPTATATTTPTNSGFRSPAANSADSGGDGNGFELNPVNGHTDDAANAVDNNSGSGTSKSCTSSSKDKHRYFNYGFSTPTGATIKGIEVRLDARADSTSGSPKMCVQLSWNGGSSWTAAKTTWTLGTSMGTFTLGSATDTWGRAWSPADFADANFRVRVIDVSSSTSRDFFLDWVAVRVTYSGGVTPTSPAPSPTPTSAPPTVTPAGPTPTGTATPSLTPPGPSPTATTAPPTPTATPTQSAPADTVAIQRAEYIVSQTTLRVEATSTNSNATLKVYVTATGALIGALTNRGDGRYEGQLSWPTNPQNIKVVSNFGGVATKTVTLK